MNDKITQTGLSFPAKISELFWRLVDRESVTDKFIFALATATLLQFGSYFAAKKAFLSGNLTKNFLSADHIAAFVAVVKFYAFLWALGLIIGIILKILRKEAHIIVYLFCFALSFSQVHQLRFVGHHVISIPFFLMFDIVAFLLMFGLRPGISTFIFSCVLYLSAILLEISGYLKPRPAVLESVTLDRKSVV